MPQRLLREGMLSAAKRHPDKIALIVEGRPYTFGQLLESSLRVASVLQNHGVRRGDRVVIHMENSWAAVISIYGTLLAGAVFVVINPQTKGPKLRTILKDCRAGALISDALLARSFLPAVEGLSHLCLVAATGTFSGPLENRPDIHPFTRLLESAEPPAEPTPVIANDLAALIYTSGSTGDPKGVMQTHQAMVFTAWSLIEYLRLDAEQKIFLFLPLAFDYGLYQLLMAMKLGATLVVEKSFAFPFEIFDRLKREKITVFPGVPTIFARMLALHRKKKLCFPSVRRVTNTAAALPVDFPPLLREIFPHALIYKMYGLTECKRVSYLEPELLEEKPASVGKAIPGTEVFLLSEEGKEVKPGETGILYVRGPHIMLGYWNRPQQSAAMLKPGPLPGERILRTGDLFSMDEDGFLYFAGRTDDIIKTRGEKVSPVEVERVLLAVDGVEEAAVLGVPDVEDGEAVHAFLAVRDDAGLSQTKVRKICSAALEPFMVPQRVIFLPSLPKTANNKIDKKKLLRYSA